MKKCTSILLVIAMLLTCFGMGTPTLLASTKKEEPRAIAIVFDNSGSMYDDGDQAWCRATYAMEVFASMLNAGDVLQIYPMHPITVGNQNYTMENPFQITDATQASSIRDIFSEKTGGTPIESIDCAAGGLQAIPIEKKYMIVLTDGGTFSQGGRSLNKERTTSELDARIQAQASGATTVMYLGIGSEACVPNTPESDHFVKKQAINTADVLSTLTEMCNMIFGRDTLPKNRISEKSMEFDISMSKLIVFVQGENISDLKIKPQSGDSEAKLISSQETKYSTKGAGDYNSVPDTSLQGMMVTYENCFAGTYSIDYSGNATSVEVYYAPDADLEFVFKDSEGNNVDLNGLYEGEYKVSFGMKDAKTGQLISSDLLGNPHYQGSYSINGQKTEFTHDGYSGEVPIALHMNDTFEADLTVTYLSGYTISKDSSDFGWPEGGVRVIAPPLGKFQAELKVPQNYILIKELGDSQPIIVSLTIDGKKLTAEEFEAVELKVDCGGIAHKVTPCPEDSQYKIQLETTKGIEGGNYQINVEANYLDKVEREAHATDSASITLSNVPLWVKWVAGLVLLLLLFLIIWAILHIRVLPKYTHTTRKICRMTFDGDDVTHATNFSAEIKNKEAKVQAKYAGKKFVMVMHVVPGPESYLYKSQKRRSAQVMVATVRKLGQGKMNEAIIGGVRYELDETTGKLVPKDPNTKPFLLMHKKKINYSGTIQDAGIDKDFNVEIQLDFTK